MQPIFREPPYVSNAAERFAQTSMRVASKVLLRRATSEPIDARSLHRVLVVRVDDRVGNVLLTTPLMRALREGLPHARLDWLIASRRRHLVEGLFLADRLIPWDKARNPASLWRSLWQLRRTKYDLVIEASHFDAPSTTGALLTRWTGAPLRVGSMRPEGQRYFTHCVEAPADVRYDVAVKLRLLEPLGLPERGHALETVAGTTDADKARADAILSQLGVEPGGFFVVNPGARKLDRRSPAESLGEVVARISEATGLTALVVWGPGEEPLAEATAQAAGGKAKVAPPNDLGALAALLRRARLLVTNDTGPMHLGVACGTPVLALFLQADAARWGHPIDSFRALQVDEPGLAERAADAARQLVGKD